MTLHPDKGTDNNNIAHEMKLIPEGVSARKRTHLSNLKCQPTVLSQNKIRFCKRSKPPNRRAFNALFSDDLVSDRHSAPSGAARFCFNVLKIIGF